MRENMYVSLSAPTTIRFPFFTCWNIHQGSCCIDGVAFCPTYIGLLQIYYFNKQDCCTQADTFVQWVLSASTSIVPVYIYKYILFFFLIPFIIFAHLLSLLPTRNSDPGSHSRLFYPLPATVRAFIFIASRFQPFLPSSTRIELCLAVRGKACPSTTNSPD